ncbi:hypothetical protein SGRIM119S_03429 [Streptomyces griseorubiginosus]
MLRAFRWAGITGRTPWLPSRSWQRARSRRCTAGTTGEARRVVLAAPYGHPFWGDRQVRSGSALLGGDVLGQAVGDGRADRAAADMVVTGRDCGTARALAAPGLGGAQFAVGVDHVIGAPVLGDLRELPGQGDRATPGCRFTCTTKPARRGGGRAAVHRPAVIRRAAWWPLRRAGAVGVAARATASRSLSAWLPNCATWESASPPGESDLIEHDACSTSSPPATWRPRPSSASRTAASTGCLGPT